jgi:Ni/Co efflux regulator RcnB
MQRARGAAGYENNRGQDYRRDNNDRGRDYRRDNNNRGREYRWDTNSRGSWNNNWRNDRRYDWRNYRSSNRDRFRAPRYRAPRGYSYRRWAPGYRLQPFFYARNYWIVDPWQYRLPPAYGPYQWVRYYDDVLLVDITTGTVVDVIPDFFWN